MAINGTASIFRLTSSSINTETLTSDKVEFDGDHLIPDAKSFMLGTRPVFKVIDTDNPNPGNQDPVHAQDTGNAPFIIEFSGYFDEKAGDALGITSIRNWMRTFKVIKTDYPKGRFGFRNNIRPEFNVTPDATAGYKLIGFECDERYEFLGLVPFSFLLRFDGDFSRLGV